MKEQLIEFETSVLAKEKGFDWKITSHYRNGKGYDMELINGGALYNMNSAEEQRMWAVDLYSAPTQSLLAKWLREVHKISVTPKLYTSGKYTFEILVHNGNATGWSKESSFMESTFETFEQVYEQGLLEALKLIP